MNSPVDIAVEADGRLVVMDAVFGPPLVFGVRILLEHKALLAGGVQAIFPVPAMVRDRDHPGGE